MIPCPSCGGYLRQRKTEGNQRTRCCLRCRKRYRTEEVILHEIGTMTEERLIRFMSERKGWQSYETIARHFCVTPSTAQTAIKKLEREGRVHHKIGERGRKLWHLTDKPVAPPPPKPKADPVAVPVNRGVVTHRIAQPGEEAPAPKRRAKTISIKRQSWFSALEK